VYLKIHPRCIATKPSRPIEILKMAVFWDVAPCSLVEVYRRFRGASCLHRDRPDDGGSGQLERALLTFIFSKKFMLQNPDRLQLDMKNAVEG
jgi:hypothetical protein